MQYLLFRKERQELTSKLDYYTKKVKILKQLSKKISINNLVHIQQEKADYYNHKIQEFDKKQTIYHY